MGEHNQIIFPDYKGNFFNSQKRVGETHADKEGLIFEGLEAAI